MHFGYDDKTINLIEQVSAFMDEHVYPAEPQLQAQLEQSVRDDTWTIPDAITEVRRKGKQAGLWNLFLPGEHSEYNGAGLSNLQYAPVAELTGRSLQLAPQAFNSAAPDTGNCEVLHMFGTPSYVPWPWSG